MNIEIAEHARMSESGSSLLRLIQNNSLPILDLLVREVVQNSLDAANSSDSCVEMDFVSGQFMPQQLNSHFDIIGGKLNQRFKQAKCDFIAVRDSNTVGLTGPLHYNKAIDGDFGNLLKLVYEISIPQQQEGAGGSWGLGKTVYFRVGIGLVIYYSRVKTSKGYETRMAASLVEDQTLPDAILPPAPGTSIRRGIAWWGEKIGKNKTQPLVNSSEIRQILKIFKLSEYTGKETGTTVIMPYITKQKILGASTNDSSGCWWHSSIEEYIRVALQRWYSPRLMNSDYPHGKWLRAKVNGKGIAKSEFLPLFSYLQKLYNRTESEGLYYKDISVRNVLDKGSIAGYVGYVKLTKDQLQMLPPTNMPDPFLQAQIPDVDKGNNPALIAYTRKPGMIVDYEVSGKWVDGIPQTPENEYIIGIFVANSENVLKGEWNGITLEEYIRKSEKADHTSWSDWNEPGSPGALLVTRIQRGVRKALSDEFSKPLCDSTVKKNIGLGRALAEILLPPENFGRKAGMQSPPQGGNGGGMSGTAGDNPRLNIVSPLKYSNGKTVIEYELYCGRKKPFVQVEIRISSENGDISASEWESQVEKAFPVQVDDVRIKQCRAEKGASFYQPGHLTVTRTETAASEKSVELQLIRSKKFSSWTGFVVELPAMTGYTVRGEISVVNSDSNMQCALTLI